MNNRNHSKSAGARSTDATLANVRGKEFCSFPTAAKLLGVGVGSIRTLVKAGTLQAFTYGRGMHRRVLSASVLALLKKKSEVK